MAKSNAGLVAAVLLIALAVGAAAARHRVVSDDEDVEQTEQMDTQNDAAEAAFIPPPEATKPFEFNIMDYTNEMIVVLLFAIYILNFFSGRMRNSSMAKQWMQANKGLMEKNFSYLGDGKTSMLIRDSNSDFIFFGSGRNHIRSWLSRISLRHRHELMGLMYESVQRSDDLVSTEISLQPTAMDTFIIAIFPKKTVNAAKKDLYDIDTFTKPLNLPTLSPDLVLFTDSPEAVHELLTPAVIAVLNHFAPYIKRIQLSDQWLYKPTNAAVARLDPPRSLNATFMLPSDPAHYDEHVRLQELLFHLIDAAGSFQLKRDAKQRADKARIAALEILQRETHAERQEAAQQRKADKIKKDLERMTPEQKQKWEEKQAEKERRKGKRVVLR